MSQKDQLSGELDERNCLGWCNKRFKPKGNEHFCEECDKKRRRLGHQLATHGHQPKSFKSPPVF
ncbi:MAG: hypothetical protein NTX00_02165 [Candidatus Parcubacteria bacterium]|nr:hypothetical protein [Candidatus Parcubacteria bacterium]